jgi:hypothetical protein
MEHGAFSLVGPIRLTFGNRTLELHDDGSVSGDRDAVVFAMEKAAEEAPTEDGKTRTLAMAERIRNRPIRTPFTSM